MKDKTTHETPVPVPEEAKQAGEIRDRWSWVEGSVWTDRMLTALEAGVKGGQWYSLMDKVCLRRNLRAAYERVRRNKGSAGVDHQTIKEFEWRLEENLEGLEQRLFAGSYRPQAVRRVWIPKPGGREKRPLGIPTVRDRIVQAAICNVLEPIFERDFADHSYGFRPGRGCKDALRRVSELLNAGFTHVVDADLKSFFDTIPHDRIMEGVKAKVADGRILKLIEDYLRQEVMETAERWTPEQGTPQGAVLSPLLANIALDPLDHLMAARGNEMVRYADDFVILCRTLREAEQALSHVRAWADEAGLKLHPDKTHVVDTTQPGGFDFLGYHFEGGHRWPRKKSMKKLKDAVRAKTKRSNGHSLEKIIADVNRSLRGWFEYFKHGKRWTFPHVDRWVRMRLRSILRRRKGLSGRGRGRDHQRWPNAFFAEHGLFSMTAAHAAACQSSRR